MADASRLENATNYSAQRKLWQSSKQDGALMLSDIIPAGPPNSEGARCGLERQVCVTVKCAAGTQCAVAKLPC